MMKFFVLPSLFLSCLADGDASCKTAECSTAASWADVADDQKQSLNMLQVKGSKLIVSKDEDPDLPACEVPDEPSLLPHGKGCPYPNMHNGVYGLLCLNGNKPYDTLETAWSECAKNEDCGAILAAAGGKFYLRRMSDPDTPTDEKSKAFIFFCGAREAYFDKKKRARELEARQEHERMDQEARTKCPMPNNPHILPFGKDCPPPEDLNSRSLTHAKGSTCLNGNKAYNSHDEAWMACAEMDGCGAIMQTAPPNRKFYLRRASDPDSEVADNAYTIQFECPAVERERQRKITQQREREKAQAERLIKTALTKCPLPVKPAIQPTGKDCPKGNGQACLNNNVPYNNLAEAWVACAEIQGCGAILQHSNGKHYLRRRSDPEMPGLAGGDYHTVMFDCPALEHATLKEVEEADVIEELQTELDKVKKLQRYEQCWDAGSDPASRDAKCEGDLRCARKGYDSRNFGDCQGDHCCSKMKLPRFVECWFFGDDQASRDEACEGELTCTRKGYADRTYGDCDLRHCCSKPPEGEVEQPAAKQQNAEQPKAEPATKPAQAQEKPAQAHLAEATPPQAPAAGQQNLPFTPPARVQKVLAEREDSERLVRAAQGKCPMPDQFHQAVLPFGKDCPKGNCLNHNLPFPSLEEGWAACAQTQDCGAIMQHSTGKFYLRRKTDPDMPRGSVDKTVLFSCPAEEEAEESDAAATKPDNVASEQKDNAAAQESNNAPAPQNNDAPAQANNNAPPQPNNIQIVQAKDDAPAKMQDQAAADNKDSAAPSQPDNVAAKEQDEAAAQEEDNAAAKTVDQSFHELYSMFDHALDTDCGLGEEPSCQWDNQAAINDGESRKEDVDGEKIVEVCGQICAEAGTECGGFTWTFSSKVCHFRKNAQCGVSHLTGTHCFQKKSDASK